MCVLMFVLLCVCVRVRGEGVEKVSSKLERKHFAETVAIEIRKVKEEKKLMKEVRTDGIFFFFLHFL